MGKRKERDRGVKGNQGSYMKSSLVSLGGVDFELLAHARWALSDCCFVAPSRPEEPPSWSGYMGKMFMAATNYLPSQVSGMMSQDRAFATVRLNFSGQRNICMLSTYVSCGAVAAEQWPHSFTEGSLKAAPNGLFSAALNTR